ncbi:MAG: LytTR family transcriptional regulator DNA-binding domain-containing protein [Pseudomonadota bacterium]
MPTDAARVRGMIPRRFDPRVAWVPFLVVAGVFLTVAFALLRPAGAAEVPGVLQLPFWALHVFPALAMLQAAQVGLMALPGYGRPAILVWLVVAGVIGAALFTPWALAMDALFGPGGDAPDPDETLLSEFANLAPILTVVWVALNTSRMLRLRTPRPAAPAATRQEPTFWRGVSADLGRDLVALSAELHYLRVRTTRGTDLVLCGFGDAVSQLQDAPGLQVHRSHWVMVQHVTRVERVGQRAVAHLSDGSTVPVSRAYRARLEAATQAAASTGA